MIVGDAGPDIRLSADPISSCSGIFAEERGTACEPWIECDERRLWCTRRHAECSLGILDYDDVEEWSGPEVDCVFAESAITVATSTETFELDSSLGSFAHEFSSDALLNFFSGDVGRCPEWRLRTDRLFPDYVSTPGGTYEGTHDSVVGTVRIGDENIRVEGRVEITSDERPDAYAIELEGSLDFAGEGVSISGTFRVVECDELRRTNI